jgi:hypothetical protein
VLPFGRVEAIHRERTGQFAEEVERAAARKRAARREPGPLGDLLDALARGLAGIGLSGSRRNKRPARAAY